MKVFVYGAGQFGKTVVKAFTDYSNRFSDVSIGDPHIAAIDDVPAKARAIKTLSDDSPDIVVITASAVPKAARDRLAKMMAPIDRFWDLERKHNLRMLKSLLPWLTRTKWRMLIIGTNPVHEWVNALKVIFPDRQIVGLGTAFDNRRIKFLAAAMCPDKDMLVLRSLRILGGHGTAISASNGKVSAEVFDTAKWMSNALSVAFIKAPSDYASLWWKKVAIDPLVEGIAGIQTQTHLVVPVSYKRTRAATSIDVIVNGFSLRPIIPKNLSASESRCYLEFLHKMQNIGRALAKQLTS